MSFLFLDGAERATSACKRLGILRFSFFGLLKSILNIIILHPVSTLPKGRVAGVVRVLRT